MNVQYGDLRREGKPSGKEVDRPENKEIFDAIHRDPAVGIRRCRAAGLDLPAHKLWESLL